MGISYYEGNYTGAQIDAGIAAANAAAPQATTYTKTEVDAALAGKVDTVSGKGLSTEDYTTAEKTKLSGIEANANKTTVSSSITQYGTNPVRSSAIYTALAGKQDSLSNTQMSAVNSGITSTSVAQIAALQNRFDLPLITGSVLDYANSLSTGTYFARQATENGSDKPLSNARYFYIINIYASTTASIIAIQGQTRNAATVYIRSKTESTWGAWFKFEGTAL